MCRQSSFGSSRMKKKIINVVTLGCSKNIVDSEHLMAQLAAAGYTVAADSDRTDARVVVVNTCGFIGDAKQESIDMILRAAAAKQAGRIDRLFVVGCLSERYADELRPELPEVDEFFGVKDWEGVVRALGGEVIEISPNSQHHINPLDLQDGYEDGENPIAMKSELITSILEQQMGAGLLSGSQKSIIDRCTASVYQNYFHARGELPMPLLSDWRAEVLKQPDPEAREIALAAELITEGSLNVFAHPTNVDINNRIVVLDLYEMGEQLRPTALVVALEAIQNRVMENRKRGKYTWVFLDEVYLYFKYKYSGEILYRAWKRFRKYGAALTAASQNVEECLKSETARLMFANSEFLLLFNQAATDRAELSKLLHISDTQLSYITNAEAGHGLLRMGGSIVPFVNTIPRQTELYKLMTTTPGENLV